MKRRRCSFAWSALWVVAGVTAAGAQRPAAAPAAPAARPMKILDLLEVPILTDPQLSPDGRQLLYVLSTADWQAGRRVGHVWRVNADGSDAVQMTAGQKGEGAPRWSPDGRRIAFTTARDTTVAQLYVMPTAAARRAPSPTTPPPSPTSRGRPRET